MRWMLLSLIALLPLQAETLKPYFSYSGEDLHLLKGLHSEREVSAEELNKWDQKLEELIVKSPLGDGEASRLTAYAYIAQRDYAALSQKQHGSLKGSIGPVTEGVVRLFYPRYQPTENQQGDHYTMALTMVVLEKVRDRFIDDQSRVKRSRINRGPVYWQGDYPYFGQKIASFKPWHIAAPNQHRCTKPAVVDETFWNEQIASMKEHMKGLTPEKKRVINYWAQSGDWITIANNYMTTANTPLEQRIAARADLATGVQDALVGAFDSKYAYCIRRPAMIDKSIEVVIPAPNHPSYPSGHSTVGAAAAEILAAHFPESKEEWQRLSDEAGMSRLWAGIHYPVDHEEGQSLGKKVARATLEK